MSAAAGSAARLLRIPKAEGLCPRCLITVAMGERISSGADGVQASGSGIVQGSRFGLYEIVALVARGGIGRGLPRA